MEFYESIAEYYEYIFPTGKAQVSFVTGAVEPSSDLSVLDVGCGAGGLALELSKHFASVIGIDLDETMVNKAQLRLDAAATNPKFEQVNMLELKSRFGPACFDIVVCFGNTLVHLNSAGRIHSFFLQANTVLRKGGKLLLQIVNYDKVLDTGLTNLPTIDNEVIRFERNYSYRKEANIVDFETVLTIKDSQKQIKNCIELLPIRKREVEELLQQAGFSGFRFYGNFNREEYTPASPALIVEAY